MNPTLKKIGIVMILAALYFGVRYIGAVIHYACAAPEEDCPPPFRVAADLGFYLTGGSFIPLWTRD